MLHWQSVPFASEVHTKMIIAPPTRLWFFCLLPMKPIFCPLFYGPRPIARPSVRPSRWHRNFGGGRGRGGAVPFNLMHKYSPPLFWFTAKHQNVPGLISWILPGPCWTRPTCLQNTFFKRATASFCRTTRTFGAVVGQCVIFLLHCGMPPN